MGANRGRIKIQFWCMRPFQRISNLVGFFHKQKGLYKISSKTKDLPPLLIIPKARLDIDYYIQAELLIFDCSKSRN